MRRCLSGMAESSIFRAFSLFLLAFAASEVFGADTEGDAGSERYTVASSWTIERFRLIKSSSRSESLHKLYELEFDDLYNNLKKSKAAHIPKGYTQAISSKVPTAPNCASHSDEIICSFFPQQASMPTTHDDEDLL
ncbi:hypothetical protein Tco_0248941 [Tanacetum coccineum]